MADQSVLLPVARGAERAGEPSVSAGPSAAPLVSDAQRTVLFGLAAVLFIAMAGFAMFAYVRESTFYDAILREARAGAGCRENVMLFEVALAPFRSLSMVRTAALFLSFVLVVLGSLFVLTGIEAAYKMTIERGKEKATLETASPGLVLVTAGALLMAASLYRSGSPEFKPVPCLAAAQSPTNSAKTLDALKEPSVEDTKP